jgi:hypothetical protein
MADRRPVTDARVRVIRVLSVLPKRAESRDSGGRAGLDRIRKGVDGRVG